MSNVQLICLLLRCKIPCMAGRESVSINPGWWTTWSVVKSPGGMVDSCWLWRVGTHRANCCDDLVADWSLTGIADQWLGKEFPRYKQMAGSRPFRQLKQMICLWWTNKNSQTISWNDSAVYMQTGKTPGVRSCIAKNEPSLVILFIPSLNKLTPTVTNMLFCKKIIIDILKWQVKELTLSKVEISGISSRAKLILWLSSIYWECLYASGSISIGPKYQYQYLKLGFTDMIYCWTSNLLLSIFIYIDN